MPAMTIQTFQIKTDEQGNPKKDNYGNTQMMIKFNESPETVYKAVKDPSTITEGKVMYGQVQESQYGWKFVADPYNNGAPAPQQPSSQPTSPPQSNELLELVKDNNRMLKLLVGEGVATSEDMPPIDSYGGGSYFGD